MVYDNVSSEIEVYKVSCTMTGNDETQKIRKKFYTMEDAVSFARMQYARGFTVRIQVVSHLVGWTT